jgi:DNA-binding transcriptional LysR family regulator
MSKTLSRLRQVFDDALFTRSGHGMQPTPRATELEKDLAAILGDISQLVSGSHFDPAQFSGEIRLALSEYIGVALLPQLVQRLEHQAPRLSLSVITRVEMRTSCRNCHWATWISQYTSNSASTATTSRWNPWAAAPPLSWSGTPIP